MTSNPYAVGQWAEATGALPYAKLTKLAQAIDALPGARNAMRAIRGDIADGRSASAKALWHRMFSRTDRNEAQKQKLSDFKNAYLKVFGAELSEYKIPEKCGALFDALELIDIGTFDPEIAKEPLKEITA